MGEEVQWVGDVYGRETRWLIRGESVRRGKGENERKELTLKAFPP